MIGKLIAFRKQFLHKPGLICLHTVKGFKYCYLRLKVLFAIVKCFPVL